VRLDFTVERPKGTVLTTWSTVIDSCSTANILYNDLTTNDTDKDLVPNATDVCPAVPAPGDGCPQYSRSLSIHFKKHSRHLNGTLSAPVAQLSSGYSVTIYRVRGGGAKKAAVVQTGENGKWQLRKRLKPGKYFASVKAATAPDAGQAPAVNSGKVKVTAPPRHHH
jgi:hypothetical protein